MAHVDFPDDLVQLQAEWQRTYAALVAPCPARSAVLRRRLLVLSVRVWWHPYWSGRAGVPAARVELRRRARALERS